MNKKHKLYIVEDDETIVELLSHHLSKTYQVFSCQNFRAILQEVKEYQPDLILMDISLPYFNGFYWTTEIRKTLTTPIIFISSADDDMSAVMAMNMGADDFISKPFSLSILEAKLTALLRRAFQFSQQDFSYNDFHLTTDGDFYKDSQHVQLSRTETKIMMTLLKTPKEVVTKEVLLEKLWENEEFIDHNTLSVNMTRMRKKAAQIGFDHIHTVRGVGYLIQ
ncbi:response regulator transcription factor [Streptococcus pacificus]|uniref:Response regulator transcription factor n=1 Tax=Streptococcus pacificus TaxID=2740577 RepID=A0ABS0ZHS9_9STRE|nr:response regulator transcription factor [Streptococcus pacificus]MBJ8325532.1 response regulator transcription factor [Streptococcus pacificus]